MVMKNPLIKCIYHDLFDPIAERKVDKYHKDPKNDLDAFMQYVGRGADKFVQRYTTKQGDFLFDKIYLDLDMTPRQLIVAEMKRTPQILDSLVDDEEFATIHAKRLRCADGVETFVKKLTDKEAEQLGKWIKENAPPLTIEDLQEGYLLEVWKQAVKVRDYFIKQEVNSYMSWSGKKGIHINIPLEEMRFKEPLLSDEPKEFLISLLEVLEEEVLDMKIGTSSLDRAVQCKGMQRIPGSRHGGSGFYANFIKPSWTYQEAVDVLEDEKCDYVPARIDKEQNTEKFKELPILQQVVQRALANNEAVRRGETSDACYTITASDDDLVANIKKLYREGQRNVVGSRIVGVLKRAGFEKDKIIAIFQTIHDDGEFRSTIGGAIDYAFKPGAKVFGMSSLMKAIEDYAFDEDKEDLKDFFLNSFTFYDPAIPQPYEIPQALNEKGWKWSEHGVYVPFYEYNPRRLQEDKQDDVRDIYLHLKRGAGNSKMRYAFTELKNGEFQQLIAISRNKLLNEEEISNNGAMKINKSIANMGVKIGLVAGEGAYVEFMDIIFQEINQHFPVFREDDFNMEKETDVEEDSTLADVIEARKNPQLNDSEIAVAKEVQMKIKEKGLSEYLDSMIVTMHMGSTRNIQQKVFIGFGACNGSLSLFNINKASAGAGKSHENDIGYNILMPKEYVLNNNRITKASLTMFGEENAEFLTRQIILFGDVGSENANQEVKSVFDVIKVLVTEGQYCEVKADGNMHGGFSNKTQELVVESIASVVETPANKDFTFDSQITSRSFEQTPSEVDFHELSKFIMALSTPGSKQSVAMERALAEAEKFHTYMRWLIGQNIEIINPYVSIFQKLAVEEEESKIREFKTQLGLFNSYCILTMHDCDEIDDKLVASRKQVEDFVGNLAKNNGLTPNEHAFVMMIKNYTNVGTVIDNVDESMKECNSITHDAGKEDTIKGDDNMSFDLDELITTAMNNTKIQQNKYFTTPTDDDYMDDDVQDRLDGLQYEDLDKNDSTRVLNKLLAIHGLGKRKGVAKRLVFRKKDIKNKFKNSRGYKNVQDDLDNTITSLVNKGYIYEFDGRATDDWAVYSLTDKCNGLVEESIITEEDWQEAEKFMEYMGF